MAVIILEDLHGTVEVVIFTKLYVDVSHKLEEGRVLLVGGRIDTIDENLQKIIATGIEDLTRIREKKAKLLPSKSNAKLVIRDPSEEILQQIAQIITAYPGECKLIVTLHLGEFAYTLDQSTTVSEEAIESLKMLGGIKITLQ